MSPNEIDGLEAKVQPQDNKGHDPGTTKQTNHSTHGGDVLMNGIMIRTLAEDNSEQLDSRTEHLIFFCGM